MNSLSNFFSPKGTYTPPVVPGAAPTGNIDIEGTYTPPVVPGAAPTGNVDIEGTYTPPVVPGAAPAGNVMPNRRGGPVNGNMEGSANTNYQELPNGPPNGPPNRPPNGPPNRPPNGPPNMPPNGPPPTQVPSSATPVNTMPVAPAIPAKSLQTNDPPMPTNAPATPSGTSNEITNSDNNRNERPYIAGSFRYGTATTSASNVGTQWGILIALSTIPLAIWIFAPSYGNTIITAFFTTFFIFGGILCMIAAVSIMMNIYKIDGTPIMLMMGFLGMFASPFIVIGYWIYHVWAWARSVKPRPYFGLFPIGFHGTPGSFWDSFLAPFHDSSNDKRLYESLTKDAMRILYGGARN